MSLLVKEAGMRLMVQGIWIAAATLRRNIVALAGSAEVCTQNLLAIEHNNNAVARHPDFLLAPLTKRPVLHALSRCQPVCRTMDLIIRQPFINGGIVIQYLHLAHSVVGRILAHRRANANTIIHPCLGEAEFKAENKVAVFAARI